LKIKALLKNLGASEGTSYQIYHKAFKNKGKTRMLYSFGLVFGLVLNYSF